MWEKVKERQVALGRSPGMPLSSSLEFTPDFVFGLPAGDHVYLTNQQHDLLNPDRGTPKHYLCEIIVKSDQHVQWKIF